MPVWEFSNGVLPRSSWPSSIAHLLLPRPPTSNDLRPPSPAPRIALQSAAYCSVGDCPTEASSPVCGLYGQKSGTGGGAWTATSRPRPEWRSSPSSGSKTEDRRERWRHRYKQTVSVTRAAIPATEQPTMTSRCCLISCFPALPSNAGPIN